MNNKEQDWTRQFKDEADENLFENLHFDLRMKERVQQQINSDRRRFPLKDWFLTNWNIRILGTVAAAMILIVVVISSSMFQDINTPTTFSDQTNVTPLIGSDAPDKVEEGEGKIWTLHSVAAAKSWYGSELLEPHYQLDHFKLDFIHASGHRKGEATQIIMGYVSERHSYQIIQQKQPTTDLIYTDETVDIHGIKGFIKTLNDLTEIKWFIEGVQFTVIGMISKDDAIKIARSLKLQK